MDLEKISIRVAFGVSVDSSLLRVAFRLVEAAKVDELISENPDFADEINQLSEKDPSKKGKYLEWCVKQLKLKANMDDLVPTIDAFHSNNQRMQKKDINQYKTLKELENAIKDLPESKTKEKARVKSEGSKKLWENDTHALFRIETRDACIQYGKGTRWCITMRDHNYWEQYKYGNTVFYYLIDKRGSEPEKESNTFSDVKVKGGEERYAKIAFAVQRKLDDNSISDVTVFDANDKTITKQTIPGIPEFSQINQMVIDDAPKAPDGAIVSMRKGTITPQDLDDYLSALDGKTLLTSVNMVIPDEKLDPVLLKILKKKEISDDNINSVVNKLKGKSTETNEVLLDLIKQGKNIELSHMVVGNSFDEAMKIRVERDPDYLNQQSYGGSPNVKLIANVSDIELKKELAQKYRARMALLGIIESKEALEKLLSDKDPHVRSSAITGIKRWQPEMLKYVIHMVNDPDPSVRKTLAIEYRIWEKSGLSREKYDELITRLLKDGDNEVVETAIGGNSGMVLSNIDPTIIKKLSVHPDEKIRKSFQLNDSINSDLKPVNDESEIVRNVILKHRKFSESDMEKFMNSEDVNERRFAIQYVKEKGYTQEDSDWASKYSRSPSVKKKNVDFAKKFLHDDDSQIRFFANSIMRKYGAEHSTDGFYESYDIYDVMSWIGNKTDRAKSVLETRPPKIQESWEYDKVKRHAELVLVVNELVDYLSGKIDVFPKSISNDSIFINVTKLLPKEFLPKLLEKLPVEGINAFGLYSILAERMDKKYASKILNKISDPFYESVGMTKIFKNLEQSEIQKFIDSNNGVIRLNVARRIDKSRLPEMIDDIESDVRRIVAERIDPEHLSKMMKDSDPKVRRRVAERIPTEYLEKMLKDKSPKVREIAGHRMGSTMSLHELLRISSRIQALWTASEARVFAL